MNHRQSAHERPESGKLWSYPTTLQIVRKIAAEDLGVKSNGESILEILQDVYAHGGIDAAAGIQTMAQVLGPDLTGAALGVDWVQGNDGQQHKDAPSTGAAGEPRTPG